MINIITGKINSFKTTRIKELFEKDCCGQGFVSLKTMEEGKVLFYEFENLQAKTKQIGIINTANYPNHFTNYETLGPYAFDLDCLQEMTHHLEKWIEQKIEPIYLDEIGLLEVNKLFFYPILKRIVQEDIETYITVRSSLVEEVVEVFGLTNYTIMK